MAEAKELTGAEAWMHPVDAEIVRTGAKNRPSRPAPGFAGVIYPALKRMFELGLPPVQVEHELRDGEVLPGGITVVHSPGASAGQVALLWERNLIAGDVFSNVAILRGHQFGYEDLSEAQRSMRRLSNLDYDNAVFGHGRPIVGNAAAKIRQRFRRTMGDAPAAA